MERDINFSPVGIDATVSGGSTTRILSSEGVSGDTAINTASPLSGTATNVTPGVGDIVMRIINDNVAGVDVDVIIGYHSL